MSVHKWIFFAVVATGLFVAFTPDRIGNQEAALPANEPTAPDVAGDVALAPENGIIERSGTAPDRYFLPPSAVDTAAVPNIVLKASERTDAPLPYYQIHPDTYLLFGNIAELDAHNRGWNANAGFVVTRAGVVVIDALGTPKLGQRLIATIRKVTDQPVTHLIITHHHPDHSYGAIAFRRLGGVDIIAHEGTLDYINSAQMQRSVEHRRSLIPEDMAGFDAVTPDVLIAGERFDKRQLEVGGRRFDIYNVGRHHSAGDLVVHQVDDHIVWVSDLAFNQRVTYMGDGHSQQAMEAQEWLLTVFQDAEIMVPGHGSAQTSPFPMVSRTHAYIERLRSFMAWAVEEGLGLQEAVDRAEFQEWQDVRLYDINQRANANFVYREMEQALF